MPTAVPEEKIQSLLKEISDGQCTRVDLHDDYGNAIIRIASALLNNKTVTSVSFHSSNIESTNCREVIVNLLRSETNISELSLDFGGIISDRTKIAIIEALAINKSITKLYFVAFPASEEVSKAFKKMLAVNRTLISIRTPTFLNPNAVNIFLSGLIKNTTITNLQLEMMNIESATCGAVLADVLKQTTFPLTSLTINYLDNANAIIAAIAGALAMNYHLTELSIHQIPTKSTSTEQLAHVLRTNRSLKTINLAKLELDDENGLPILIDALKSNQQLYSLHFQPGKLFQESAQALHDTLLEANDTLISFSATSCMSRETINQLLYKNRKNPHLASNTLKINQGGSVTLNKNNLYAYNHWLSIKDSTDEAKHGNTTFRLLEINNGCFFKIETNEAILAFSTHDIREGKIGFASDGTDTAPTFTFVMDNRSVTSLSKTGNVIFTPLPAEQRTTDLLQLANQKSLRHINTQLFSAAKEGDVYEIERLLNCGAEINSPHIDPRDGSTTRTPLSIATEMRHDAAIELLSQRGADLQIIDQPVRNIDNWSLYNETIGMLSHYNRRFFKPTFDNFCETLSITVTHPLTPPAILFSAIMLFYKDEILKDNYKLASAILGFTGLMLSFFNLLKLFRNVSDNIYQTHERVIANLDASERAIDVLSASMTLTTKEVVKTLSTLTGTTQEVMIQLKDEAKNNLIELRGDARHVALAIEQGIRDNRFKPEAHVVANTHVNATAHVHTSAKVNVPLRIGVPRILPNFVNRILPRALRF